MSTVLSEQRGPVLILTFNRPKALNAINSDTWVLLHSEMKRADRDDTVRCVVVTGGDKVFAAGADIKEMKGNASKNGIDMYRVDALAEWDSFRCRKPVIAAVAGFALGGGMEVVMMADIVLCTPSTKFGLPELSLGIIPAGGGTQRLPRLVGKAIALDMLLTGRRMDAQEAAKRGVVSRVVREGQSVTEEAIKVAQKISQFGGIAVMAAKEAANAANDLPLSEGLRLERRLAQNLFTSKDQIEGMAAFVEKRQARFSHL